MPLATVRTVREVGSQMIAIELESPPEFDADPGQFVKVEATKDGDTESGYYTLSSPTIDETFEITAKYDSSGTVGPWLAEREAGDEISFTGPYGDIRYTGGHDVVVVASGPGIGPAVGIAERALDTGAEATVIYHEASAYSDRLEQLDERGARIHYVSEYHEIVDQFQSADSSATYVFGFAEFISSAKDALAAAGIDSEVVHIENFGPE
ncbi:MAG: ferredoxin-NADP reductase [Natrialbaceae archaeon]|jgi:ferredoxin-NADP reductase